MTRRIDSAGRDVTDLPGLWDESDKIVSGETETEKAEEDAVESSRTYLPFGLKNHCPEHIAELRRAYQDGFREGRLSAVRQQNDPCECGCTHICCGECGELID